LLMRPRCTDKTRGRGPPRPILERTPPTPGDVLAGGVAHAPSAWARAAHQPVFFAFLLCFAFVWGGLMPGVSWTREGRWLEVVFWLLAFATSLVGLARRLPGQNVLMSAALVAALSFGIAVVAE